MEPSHDNEETATTGEEVAPSKNRWIKKEYLLVAAIIVVPLVAVRGCNMACNNRVLHSPGYDMASFATGLTGHVEYTRYDDGSQDVKVYPSLGHRLWDSEFYQDLDGDGKIDRIRRHGAEWKYNRLTELLVREHDYEDQQERFDEADEMLQELMSEYSRD